MIQLTELVEKDAVVEELTKLLRPKQIQAIQKMIQYLQSDSMGTDLVKMPTGTGKTGVMAVISEMLFNSSVIIVVSNTALPQQIINELHHDFWETMGFSYIAKKSLQCLTPRYFTNKGGRN